jgi:hypothetical protein
VLRLHNMAIDDALMLLVGYDDTAFFKKLMVAVGGHDSHRDDHAYADVTRLALAVVERYPASAEHLAVLTWFYGHQLTNVISTAIAMCFANGSAKMARWLSAFMA